MQWLRRTCAALAMTAFPGLALAQTETPPPTIPSEIAAPAVIRIPAGTIIEVELVDPLSSRTSQIGDFFALRLRAPIVVEGREIVNAGAVGAGEVIDADSSGFGGRQGKLIISARYLDIGGQRVRIRGMQLTAVGRDRVNTALAVSMIPYAGIAGIFLSGGEIDLPAGAYGTARLAVDLEIPEASLVVAATEQTAPVEAPSEQAAQSGETSE
jgi:hypothetical protein